MVVEIDSLGLYIQIVNKSQSLDYSSWPETGIFFVNMFSDSPVAKELSLQTNLLNTSTKHGGSLFRIFPRGDRFL